MSSQANARFLASTRGQVVILLRQGLATVDELATTLGLTDNAVRAHLAGLERDGLVVQAGVRRGGGKPAYTYAITADAEQLFPKAYGAILSVLLDVLGEHLTAESLDDALREVGRRLASAYPPATGTLPERAGQAVEVLAALGGLATVEAAPPGAVIAGCRCPLAAVVAGHPATCLMAEALLSDLVGAPVRQACEPEIPRCRFIITPEEPAH
ncbi:MAG: ArsR family transcriptional regulator [Thermomicrobiales bacterium]|nr:ArsR family transcriptional regulator [Thermomicrobiales bacterium]